MDDTHACPAPNCDARVKRSQLACRAHWYSIPKALRNAVWNAFRTHGMGSDEHTEAITAAIKYLHDNA